MRRKPVDEIFSSVERKEDGEEKISFLMSALNLFIPIELGEIDRSEE